jgi:hypothetical protein
MQKFKCFNCDTILIEAEVNILRYEFTCTEGYLIQITETCYCEECLPDVREPEASNGSITQ